MRDRFGLIINSTAEDITVRKTLVMLLGTWASKFEGEQGMQILQRLYEQGRRTFRENSNHVTWKWEICKLNTLIFSFVSSTHNTPTNLPSYQTYLHRTQLVVEKK